VSDPDLLPLLTDRLRGSYAPLLADTTATILFTAGGLAEWTVAVDRGRTSARPGRAGSPTTTVRAALPVLHDVISGRRDGVEAFLSGDLTVRGSLTLALQLDGLFPGERDDRARIRARHVVADGTETFFLEAGRPDAPPVVLVHGLSATNASMLPLIPRLAEDYRVLAPDLPGHGGTQARSAQYEASFLGRWLCDFLAQTCDRPAAVIGNSLGGRTALQVALDCPESVQSLVLLCPALAFRRMRQLVPLVRLVPDEVVRLPMVLPRPMAVRAIRRLFAEPDRFPRSWYDAAVDEFLRVQHNPANRQATLSALRHIYLDEPFGDAGFWNRLPLLRPPALFVWGDRDALVPARFAGPVRRALPTARSVVLEDCGHVPQFEHPDRTARLIEGFLRQTITPPPAVGPRRRDVRRERAPARP
jgi:pimeloyl-ACP methyl ester carboxylesterase